MDRLYFENIIRSSLSRPELIEGLAHRFHDAYLAHERLRHKGYGGDGIGLLETVDLVPFNDFHSIKSRAITI
jgi:hypothetical protein